MYSHAKPRNTGKRSLTTAILLSVTISYWLFGGAASWHSRATDDASWISKQQTLHELSQHATDQQKQPQHDVQPEVVRQDDSRQDSPAASPIESQPEPHPDIPECGVTRISMLYGAHKFPQLDAALETHRRHGDRWGCKFESLKRDITTRKLYSKHYFLLSALLRQLSRPEEERQKWLL